MKSRRHVQIGWLVACVLGVATQASSASAQTIISPNNEVHTCSELLQGDNEFWGAGPYTSIRLDLMLNATGTGVGILVQMAQFETAGNSVGYARSVITVAQAPAGKRITHMQTLGPSGWVWTPLTPGAVALTQSFIYTDTNTTRDTMTGIPWWLESVTVDGDRAGPDLFTNCSNQPNPQQGSGIFTKPARLTFFAQ